MKKIKAVVRVDDRTNTHYTKTFLVRDTLPVVGDEQLGYVVTAIDPVELDFENRGDDFVEHDFYRITSVDTEYQGKEDEGEYTSFDYVAIRKAEVG